MSGQRSFLLVHGGMHGAWCWRRVAPLLVRAGHYVVTPTLTGLGHRARLGNRATSLADHIDDILDCIDCEELDYFVLVGHSYAGMVITGVADRIAERVAHLVYLDALVPRNGQAAADLVPRGPDYSQFSDGMLPPIPGYDFGVTVPEDIAWVRRRLTPQSVRTVTEAIMLTGAIDSIPRTFIECAAERGDSSQMASIAAGATRLAEDPAWRHVTLRAGHDCMISHPEMTAAALLQSAALPRTRKEHIHR